MALSSSSCFLLSDAVLNAPLILASTSPRRRELLATLGLTFTVLSPPVDEAAIDVTGLTPDRLVVKLASQKAQSVADSHPDALVIGADTVVVLDNQVLGKPTDAADAVRMLGLIQGREHIVFTGMTVCYQGRQYTAAEQTRVWVTALSPEACEHYVQTGEPMDKAGAYAIQGIGSTLVERIDGCYFNVVGLPLHRLSMLIRQAL